MSDYIPCPAYHPGRPGRARYLIHQEGGQSYTASCRMHLAMSVDYMGSVGRKVIVTIIEPTGEAERDDRGNG